NNQFLAQTTAGAVNTTNNYVVGADQRELIRFYSDPADNTTANLISSASITTGWNIVTNGAKLVYNVTFADFDPVNNTYATIATGGENNIPTNGNFPRTLNFTLTAPGYTLPVGHRMVWIISAQDSNASHTTSLNFLFNGAAASGFDSRGTVCLQPV